MMMFRIPAALLFFALGASAAPRAEPMQVAVQQITRRDVWVPPITEPDQLERFGKLTRMSPSHGTYGLGEFTKRHSGVELTISFDVRRDTSDPPQEVTNPKGTILLGFYLANGTGGENLDIGQSLPAGACIFRLT
jgi:hypothetical protein